MKKPPTKPAPTGTKRATTKSAAAQTPQPKLLSGGNPQVAKADGDAPVQEYISAMPGWKHDIGKQIDAIITKHVPNVRKCVRWNSPLYGVDGNGWFISMHCFTRYVKVTFFNGEALAPPPPGESKRKEVRYLDVYESEGLDQAQFTNWVKQASKLPGWSGS